MRPPIKFLCLKRRAQHLRTATVDRTTGSGAGRRDTEEQLVDMIDEDVLRRTGVDIRGKSLTNGETLALVCRFPATSVPS